MTPLMLAVANGFILSVPLMTTLWLALRLSRRTFNAATRYGIWWMALVATVVLPVFFLPINLLVQHREKPTPIRDASVRGTLVPAAPITQNLQTRPTLPVKASRAVAFESVQVTTSVVRGLPIPIRLPASKWPMRIVKLLVSLWVMASLLLFARLARSFAILHLRKANADEAPSSLQKSMEQSLAACGVSRHVRIAVVNTGDSPVVAGPLRPCVLIPARLLAALDNAEVEQICLHEAAHLARYDDWSLLLQRMIEALFVFHPVTHWIARQIDLEREIACDDFVIATTGQPHPYASCLTHVAELAAGYSASPLAAAVVDEASHLTKRIVTLLDKSRRTGTRVLKVQLVAVVLALFVLTWLAGGSPAVLALIQPPVQSLETLSDVGHASSGRVKEAKVPNGPNTNLAVGTDETSAPQFSGSVATVPLTLIPSSDFPPMTTVDDAHAQPAPSGFEFTSTNRQEWEAAAGGTRAFEVTSVKQNKPEIARWPVDPEYANVPMGNGDVYVPSGGHLSAKNLTLLTYISFAFKVMSNQMNFVFALLPEIPAWASTDRFDIEAQAAGSPTKDQMRLMMQSLLADRFKLKFHYETRQLPVYALILANPGEMGPRLRQHLDDSPCARSPTASDAVPPAEEDQDGFPSQCGNVLRMRPVDRAPYRFGARNVSMERIADSLTGSDHDVDRPVLDRTGLAGTFDYTIKYMPQINDRAASRGSYPWAPTLLEALRDQLGLELVPQIGPVDVVVIDHIERPSPD